MIFLVMAAYGVRSSYLLPAPPEEPAPAAETPEPSPSVPATDEPDSVAPVKVSPTTLQDMDAERSKADLKDPENLKTDAFYDEETGEYRVGTKLGDDFLETPFYMSTDEYQDWAVQRSMREYYRKKNQEDFQAKGKEKFDFTDMHFDLGKANKIFGPGGVRVKTQGSAELKLGGNMRFTDNPSLSERNRRVFGFDFDEKINLSLNGKVGDKINMDFNYNSEATFNFDTQNLKLKYDGKEDEIIKLLEAGYVSMPTNSSLIRGASSLFGVHGEFQFGKLKVQTVIAQKKSATSNVSSKGGKQLSSYELSADGYDENRHFFLSHFFRDHYDEWMEQLPNVLSGIKINRIEVWVTNKTGATNNTRNIIALTDLAERDSCQTKWKGGAPDNPANSSNSLYADILNGMAASRDISQTTQTLDQNGFVGGEDYEKLESARLLSSSEYRLNSSLGYISLKSSLQTDQVLAVAYEYTYRGQTYQVGEFSTDLKDNTQALFVKTLKNTANTPHMRNWHLMMKNVYSLGATSVQKEKFKLDIKILSDTSGVYLSYLPEPGLREKKLIQLLGMDRLDNNNKHNPNGYFDYVEGYTIEASSGRIYFPVVEPFGKAMEKAIGKDLMKKYGYSELYNCTRTEARQIAEKNKYIIAGEYNATKNDEIQLGSMNIPPGSVVVTAGGVTLTEGSDYTVDYNSGIVKILNKSILDAGTNVNVSLESNTDYGMQRKTMFGLGLQYDFSKNFSIGGTFMHLGEKPLTTKVAMGSEALNNTLWGVNLSWKKESQRLTDWLNKVPFFHCTAPSSINFSAEFAQLIAGKNRGTQGNASYLDDFEQTKSEIDVSNPVEWTLCSTPSNHFDEGKLMNDVRYGFNRALLAWYYIDPLFTRRSSSLTPGYIKTDTKQLSDPDVREIYKSELFPNKSINYKESNTLNVLNLAYYPTERGPYNLDPNLNPDGSLPNPKQRWGGMMRKLDNSDFETANVEYIEFWLMDPFVHYRDSSYVPNGGKLYFQLGEISEDILKDGKKFYESGLPTNVNDTTLVAKTVWGRVPTQTSVTYAFNTASGARKLQDVGFNGLPSEAEASFPTYSDFLQKIVNRVDTATYNRIKKNPSADQYHYFRGADYDNLKLGILDRYKYINNPNGNSAEATDNSYSTAYKTTPDAEDINADYTLNEYEKFFEYSVDITPGDTVVGRNYIVDKRTTSAKTRDNNTVHTDWYLFRIPVDHYTAKYGNINDFSSIRFMRMFMTEFEQPQILRFATLNLVRGEWREYEQNLYPGQAPSQTGTMAVSAVNFEENNEKTPVNYVLPPGISRVITPGEDQVLQNNEQSLSIVIENLAAGDARAVYKNTTLDLRRYKHLQMFAHANAMPGDETLHDGETSIFLRLGSDYKSNYYEYEVPLKLTAPDRYGTSQAEKVWPQDNMFDIDLSKLTDAKRDRNKKKALNLIGFNDAYTTYDPDKPNNKITVQGNPSLGEVRTIMIGVRNNSRETKSVEVWANELRLQNFANKGGWALQSQLQLQLSDMASVNVSGHVETAGFGGLEESVTQRRDDNLYQFAVTANLEAGKLLPEKVKLNAPIYYSYSKQITSPEYDPHDNDMTLSESLDAHPSKAERDSIKDVCNTVVVNKNFSITGLRFNRVTKSTPMPYDLANFTFGYAHSAKHTSGETTAWERDDTWKWQFAYGYTPNFKPWEPFKKIKSKTPWLKILKEFGFNYCPQNLTFTTDLNRQYYELQERDLDVPTNKLPITWSSDFLFNRAFQIRWDLTKAIHASFSSGTNAEIEQPYTAINKDLYPDRYTAWKDSVWHSIKELGRPLTYAQQFDMSWTLPLNKIPCFDWITADAKYTSTYNWARGTELTSGQSMGNTISTQRNITGNGRLNFETLYNHWDFLKEVNKKYSSSSGKKKVPNKKEEQAKRFEKEVTLKADTTVVVQHNQKSKSLRVTAIRKDGSRYSLKYKVLDANKIEILSRDTASVKVAISPKRVKEDQAWFKIAQGTARVLMLVRNVSVSYRNTYNLSVPGFTPNVGDILGQRPKRFDEGRNFAPGLDFAFGFVDDNWVKKADERGWLLKSDSILTPATSSLQEDLSIKATLEPLRDVKIDLTWNRNTTNAKQMQYMYAGCPTMQTGSFTQTIISIGSAFKTIGSPDDGYRNATFQQFMGLLDGYQQQLQSQYAGSVYPDGTALAGMPYDPANGVVDKYSPDVLIPAFLKAYTSASEGMKIFPSIKKMLPNWSVTYAGLAKLPRMKKVFRSFNLTHAYKSTYVVGSYNTYNTYRESTVGFVNDVSTGLPRPSSMYDVSTITVNESFAPLVGLDMTFRNSLSAKIEYRKTRTLNLSLTSQQLNETHSNDWVFGAGYKIADLKLFKTKTVRKAKTTKRGDEDEEESASTSKNNASSGFAHSLNIRFDFTLRDQSALQRNILTGLSQATSGNKSIQVSFSAEYAVSRFLTLTAYYDRQKNVPLLTSSSYPSITQDFGVSVKFTLTH